MCERSRPRPPCRKSCGCRSFIKGNSKRTISSRSIGPRLSGRNSPLIRTIGGRSTFRCKSLPSILTRARKSLSTSSSCFFPRNAWTSSSEAVLTFSLFPFSDMSISSSQALFGSVHFLQPDRNSAARHDLFRFLNGEFTEVEDAGSQCGVRFADGDGIGQMFGFTGPATGNYRNRHGFAHSGEFQR